MRILLYSLLGKIYQDNPLFSWRASEPPFTLTYDLMVLEIFIGCGLTLLIKLFFTQQSIFDFFLQFIFFRLRFRSGK